MRCGRLGDGGHSSAVESGKTVACGIAVGISTESKAIGIRKG